jgi:FkbM family methyltransferase
MKIGKRLLLEVLRRASISSSAGRRLEALAHFILVAQRGSYDIRSNGEHWLINRVLRQCPTSSTLPVVMVDVGANVGNWTAAVLESAGTEVEVHCFEPTPSTFSALKDRYGHDSRVQLSHVALSNQVGTAQLRDYGNHSGLNSLVHEALHDGSTEIFTIPTITGDAYCRASGIHQINLLKVDVEGFEWEVLAGFTGMLRNHQIDIVQFEYGYVNAVVNHFMRDFYAFFEEFRYVVGPLRPRGPEFRAFRYSDDNFDSGPNFVAALPAIAQRIVGA